MTNNHKSIFLDLDLDLFLKSSKNVMCLPTKTITADLFKYRKER